MSRQLADEARRIAEREAAEIEIVGEILSAHFREVLAAQGRESDDGNPLRD